VAESPRKSRRKAAPKAGLGASLRAFVRRVLRLALFASLVSGLVAVLALAFLHRHYVVNNPGEHLQRSHILALISQESPVFYRDGETRLGVFFADEHRQYLPYERIPQHFIDALVAAEDQDFWEHGGFSPSGIARAMVSNLKAGRVVAGGSTLTQQTAKNLYKRQGRTYREKLRELANALRLEQVYSKEDILEFYSNQFYVNGNGRGLSIAARFFFDREVEELGLLECAFLAGVVKSPNRYNPWVAGDERRERAQRAAHERARYVLGRMLEDGRIDRSAYDEAAGGEIPFLRGHFRFERSVILDQIEKELNGPYFSRLLAEQDIANFATSGLQVISTIDAKVQRGATYGLRHHLTTAGTWLEAPKLMQLFRSGAELRPVDPERVVPRSFHDGVLRSVDPKSRRAVVDLGGIEGTVDAAGNKRLARARKRAAKRNLWADSSRAEVRSMVEKLGEFVGQSVTVSVRSLDAETGAPVLDWEWEPQLQGAVVVLQQGATRALVGGARNTDFNRAMVAKRQFGSTWKPLLFQAALQLRWSTTDRLDNRRSAFPYQGWFYYPRPDHKGAPESVSMAWAAAKSENVASIWLLYHLTDQLNAEQFRQIAEQVGLSRAADESIRAFATRVQKAGVVATRGKVRAGVFDQVREEALVDLSFSGRQRESDVLRSLHYGLGFDAEEDKLGEDDETPEAEIEVRETLLDRSFLRQEELRQDFAEERAAWLELFARGSRPSAQQLQQFALLRGSDGSPRLSFGDSPPGPSLPLGDDLLDALLAGRAESYVDALAPAVGDGEAGAPEPAPVVLPVEPEIPDFADEADLLFGSSGGETEAEGPDGAVYGEEAAEQGSLEPQVEALLDPAAVVMNGMLSAALLSSLREAIDEGVDALDSDASLYHPASLALCHDFRVLVGLRYLRLLAERSGVRSEVREVLSLPLGSSELTLLEAAGLYQVMQTGSTWDVSAGPLADAVVVDGDPSAAVAAASLIAELRLADGRVVYRAQRSPRPAQTASISLELASLLRAVVRLGTGRRAEGRISPHSEDPERAAELLELGVRVPLFGKTGTTNAYRNSAFVGVVPGLPEGGDRLRWDAGQVVATYVGYDDNREMKRGAIRVAGSSGSLPVWIETVQAVVDASDLGDRVDLADIAFGGSSVLPLDWPEHFSAISVDLRTGLPAQSPGGETTTLMRRTDERSFSPFLPLAEDFGDRPAQGSP
jgi:membrane peptidoglycan carboxypeptidase